MSGEVTPSSPQAPELLSEIALELVRDDLSTLRGILHKTTAEDLDQNGAMGFYEELIQLGTRGLEELKSVLDGTEQVDKGITE